MAYNLNVKSDKPKIISFLPTKQYGKDGVDKFIEMKSYKGFPFDKITQEQWGFDLIQEVG